MDAQLVCDGDDHSHDDENEIDVTWTRYGEAPARHG